MFIFVAYYTHGIITQFPAQESVWALSFIKTAKTWETEECESFLQKLRFLYQSRNILMLIFFESSAVFVWGEALKYRGVDVLTKIPVM